MAKDTPVFLTAAKERFRQFNAWGDFRNESNGFFVNGGDPTKVCTLQPWPDPQGCSVLESRLVPGLLFGHAIAPLAS
jgi:hypothetical protein